MVMVLHTGALTGDRGLHAQPGRLVIFVPLAHTPDCRYHEHSEHQAKHQYKQDLKPTAKEK
jgi:hypothetical protein